MVSPRSNPPTPPGGAQAAVGADLPTRAAAAVVLGSLALAAAWAGGLPFLALLARRRNRRAMGMAAADRRRPPVSRVAVGAVALGAAGYFASLLHLPPLGRSARRGIVIARGARRRLGRVAGRRGSGPGSGVLYAGALVVSVCLLRASPALRLPCDPLAVRRRVGRRRAGLFRRQDDRRAPSCGRAFRRARHGPGRSSARSGARSSAFSFRRGRAAACRASPISSVSASRRRSSPNSATSSNPRSSAATAPRIRAS